VKAGGLLASGGPGRAAGSRSRNGCFGNRSGGFHAEGRLGDPELEPAGSLLHRCLPPACVRDGLRSGSYGQRAGKREDKPQGCEWPKHVTGIEKGANRQGRGKRRRRTEAGVEPRDEASMEGLGMCLDQNVASGSGPLVLGAPKGIETQGRTDARKERLSSVVLGARTDARTRSSRASERPRAVSNRKGNRPGGCSAEDTRAQAARQKGRRWSRGAKRAATPGNHTLKVDATPRRVQAATGSARGR
jgi:hypothetical protein